MNRKLRNSLLKYGVTLTLIAAAAAGIAYLHGYGAATEVWDKWRILSDACLIPGTVVLLVGVLVALSNGGNFIGISYALGHAIRMLLPGSKHKDERYYDYYQRKMNRKKVTGYSFLLICGAIGIAVAVVFLILFYRTWPGY